MNDSDRDVLRTIIREELHAVLGELETARVRRSAALEELVRNDGELFRPDGIIYGKWVDCHFVPDRRDA